MNIENIDVYIEIIGAVLGVLTLIAAITPTERDNGVINRLNNVFKKLTGRK